MLQDLKNPMTDGPFVNPKDDEAYEAILRVITRVSKNIFPRRLRECFRVQGDPNDDVEPSRCNRSAV